MGTKRPSNTLYSVSDHMPSKHRSRAVTRNVSHTDDFMLKAAVAVRLQQYADANLLGDHIDGVGREAWLRKVRAQFKGRLHTVDWSPEWFESMQPELLKLGLPPLED